MKNSINKKYNKTRTKIFTEQEMQKIEDLKKQKEFLKLQLKSIQDEITKINKLEYHRYYYNKKRDEEWFKNTKAYQMFGKRRQDFTIEEMRKYNQIIQQEFRRNKL